MATGSYGIITRGEANALLPNTNYKFFTDDLTRCPTYDELNGLYYTADTHIYHFVVTVPTYESNQLVRGDQCTVVSSERTKTITVTMHSLHEGTSRLFSDEWTLYQSPTYQANYTFNVTAYSGTTVLSTANVPVTILAEKDGKELYGFRFKDSVTFTMNVPIQAAVTKLVLDPSSYWYAGISSGQYMNVNILAGSGNTSVTWTDIVVEWPADYQA